jgi:ribosomal protein S18 acetylase RimI-like enzyme
MGEVDLSSLPQELIQKLPKHPVPVARMGRLAVDRIAQGRGLGKFLLVDAMKRVQNAAASIGVYALLVDAKDDTAKAFYKKYGFVELVDLPLSLFLPVASFPR